MKPVPLPLTTIYLCNASQRTLAALLATDDLQHAILSYNRACLDEVDSEDAELQMFQTRRLRPLQPGDQIFTASQGSELTPQGDFQAIQHRTAILTIQIVDGHQTHQHLYRLALPANAELETWLDGLTEEERCDLPMIGNAVVPLAYYGSIAFELWWESEDQEKQRERLLAELSTLGSQMPTPDWASITGEPMSVKAFRQMLQQGRQLTCVYRHVTNTKGEVVPPSGVQERHVLTIDKIQSRRARFLDELGDFRWLNYPGVQADESLYEIPNGFILSRGNTQRLVYQWLESA